MAEWVVNTLTITGDAVDRQTFRERAHDYGPRYKPHRTDSEPLRSPKKELLSFHAIVPVPDELLQRTYGGEDEGREAEAAGVSFDPKSPDFCGSSWEWVHWGVKWGAVRTIVDETADSLIYDFETPWWRPLNFVGNASERFPGLTFDLEYISFDLGFEGRCVVKNGELLHLEHWDIDDLREPILPDWSAIRESIGSSQG